MPRVSIRTLVLLLELLLAVVTLQYIAVIKPARANAVWLAGECVAAAPAPSAGIDGTTALQDTAGPHG